MRAVYGLIPTYSSDEFGICSALYELGGMVVMHDASGCNSTYTTHDEPRWYRQESLIFISAISEMEAIMGDDDKLIEDICQAAEDYQPAFVAIVGAPIPYMIGTDFQAIAQILEERLGIPCFGFAANGMNGYIKGMSMAMEALAKRYAKVPEPAQNGGNPERTDEKIREKAGEKRLVNLIGATPLDFSINGQVESIREWLKDHDMACNACFCMGDTLSDIERAGAADVSLVLSAGGLACARYLKEAFGIPYVVGVPYGREYSEKLAEKLKNVAGEDLRMATDPTTVIIGESVTSVSLSEAIFSEYGIRPVVLCMVDTDQEILRVGDRYVREEDQLIEALKEAKTVIADPMYRVLCTDKIFYELPHVAFSGRCFEKRIPNLIGRALKEEEKC